MQESQKINSESNNLPAFIFQNVPLSDKNWFKTGGCARFFCEPSSYLEFSQTINFANQNNLDIFLLGEGANILISDEGFDGLVIRPKLKNITKIVGDTNFDMVKADAGVVFEDLINWCLDQNLSGLEEFSGIPGNVGGSVFINIHYFEFLLSQFIVSGEVINKKTGAILTVDWQWFNFGYNYTSLHESEYYLLSATFKLKKITDLEAAYAKGRKEEIQRHRNKRYPTSNTCGSFFRNFHEHEVTLTSGDGKKLIYVAYYLDKIGVKGQLSIGDAIVSYQHANMIVNKANATTADIINLARAMQELVKNNFGIIPQPECRLIGFKNYPLLK